MFDVTIIGAGPAGCVAAISLAQRAHRVALVEQHRFPRDKVCGECLSALGIDVLTRFGLKNSLLQLGPTYLRHSELIAPSGEIASVELPQLMWGLSRSALDLALLERARDAGVEVHQPARCESVKSNNPSVTVRDLQSNELRTLTSRYIFIAEGKAACGLAHPPPTTDLGIKAHFENVRGARDTISLFGLSGHYVGLAPIEGSRWNVAMSVPAKRVRRFQGDLDALFAHILTENIELARRMAGGVRVGEWMASPLPRFPVASTWPTNVIPLGNAAAASFNGFGAFVAWPLERRQC